MKFVDEFRDADLAAGARRARSPRCASPAGTTRSWRCAAGTPTPSTATACRTTCPTTSSSCTGPGCPVCVIPMGRVDDGIAIARAGRRHPDLLRRHDAGARRATAPSWTPTPRGADIRMVYSPLDALRIARQNPDRQVVFYAIGFETTAPSTALTVLRAKAEGIDELLGLLQPRHDHPGHQGDPRLARPAAGRLHRARPRLHRDRLPAVRVDRPRLRQCRWCAPASSRSTCCSRST